MGMGMRKNRQEEQIQGVKYYLLPAVYFNALYLKHLSIF